MTFEAPTGIKPIETRYMGYRFRSRIEARWAVFYDALNVEYRYEPDGYDLGQLGWYLPDFWLPLQSCFVEIKGARPSQIERDRCEALSDLTGYPVFMFFGEVPLILDKGWSTDIGGLAVRAVRESWSEAPNPRNEVFDHDDPGAWAWNGGTQSWTQWDDGQFWHECGACSAVGIQYCSSDNRICTDHADRRPQSRSPRLEMAAVLAREARF